MQTQVRITGDGSPTLYNPQLDETYHSMHGAVGESRHVFIENGLEYYSKQHDPGVVKVLEVGFGTALNALLSWEFARSTPIKVDYTTLEPYPLDSAIIHELFALLPETVNAKDFKYLHALPWEQTHRLCKHFAFCKLPLKVQDLQQRAFFDVVYYDAFAPNKQPDIWKPQVLARVLEGMKPGSVLVSYCAQGQFKRDLAALGFQVQTLEGPPGKKEMTRAIVPQ